MGASHARAMSDEKASSSPTGGARPLSIEQLEAGLRFLNAGSCDSDSFWDANVATFRLTALAAIRETSDALLSSRMPERWRAELEGQVVALRRYVELADDYVARRARSSTLN
jgi:hypothetical protein